MASQYTVALTVSSRNRNTARYPHAHSYEMKLPTAIPRVRQVMLSTIEVNSASRNVDSPGELFPFARVLNCKENNARHPGNSISATNLLYDKLMKPGAGVRAVQHGGRVHGAGIVGLTPLLASAEGADRPNAFRVGDAVRARRPGFSHFCPGEIVCAHANHTYNVRFADGHVQRHVARCHVEAPPPPADTEHHRPPGAGGYRLIPTWRPACTEDMSCDATVTTTTLKVDLPAKLNRVVGIVGDQVTMQAPHGLRGALCGRGRAPGGRRVPRAADAAQSK